MDGASRIPVQAPLDEQTAARLRSGDRVLLSGTVYTLRDAGHQRLVELLKEGGEPPFPLRDAVIYYVGPTPATGGRAIGSAGPTTSSRMDPYTPYLIERGLRGMIGKGCRDLAVIEAMKKCGAVYFAATGGAGALLSKTVLRAELLAWEELGTEALRRLTIKDMPLTVIIDSQGSNLYEDGPRAWRMEHGGND
ncbi:MAG TPA: Fe-S-containing hydro-lyase [Bacillota bacterium]|jgi:fumarate hydratase subunit beta|nr:Fe-S-containing hydro-lyase [Fastidiosipila sp.]HPX93187.1 Fe-S-containing hydro-lyase [Bacillota bacterium]HQB81500.1 Fe-S-containing hydro-lyase [Bacillota bacterium]